MRAETALRIAEAEAKGIVFWAAHLGLMDGLRRAGREWVGPCPVCGGEDRFSINPEKNIFFCRRSQKAGGAIRLVEYVRGCDFGPALDWMLGPRAPLSAEAQAEAEARAEEVRKSAKAAAEREAQAAARRRARAQEDARAIWRAARPAEGTPVRDYLARRGIDPVALPEIPAALRYHPNLDYVERSPNGAYVTLHSGPAMLAIISDSAGRGVGLHRTWLDLDQPKGTARIIDPQTGAKLPPKKTLGHKKGGVIRLSPYRRTAPVMVMGEGIETTLTACAYSGLRRAVFWCGIDMGNMAGKARPKPYNDQPDLADNTAFAPPPWVEALVYVMDGDSDPIVTRRAMEVGLRRALMLRPGLRAKIVAAPRGMDLNDMVMEGADDQTL